MFKRLSAFCRPTAAPTTAVAAAMSTAPATTTTNRTPAYFVSHGGPNVMFETEHPAFRQLQEIGREITQRVKPKAVVVFSAHWQAGPKKVEVNEAEVTKLIYE